MVTQQNADEVSIEGNNIDTTCLFRFSLFKSVLIAGWKRNAYSTENFHLQKYIPRLSHSLVVLVYCLAEAIIDHGVWCVIGSRIDFRRNEEALFGFSRLKRAQLRGKNSLLLENEQWIWICTCLCRLSLWNDTFSSSFHRDSVKRSLK
jgi:hypothetical protein